jgi:cysteine sulfinate desulfinase/cysteine desulfurase-like protein
MNRHLAIFAACLSVSTLASSAPATAATPKPTILFLFTDDQSWETIRALGHTDIDTPNLDRLVERITTFTHTYNMGSWSGGIPNTELNGHPSQRLANTTNITLHGVESEALLILLDQEGICASSGSACLADSDEPSHAVKAMNPDASASRQMIRFSLGLDNTQEEVEAAIAAVRKAVNALRG